MNPDGIINTSVIALGDFSIFIADTLRAIAHSWKRRGLFIRQCEFIGVSSVPVVGVAGVFLGAVLGYQLYVSFHVFGAEAFVGGSIGYSLFRELAPVMTGVMVVGRAGAAMAAEIASMRISEQIDALEVMAVDPIEYLVVPRVLAGILMMPILSILFTMVASFAAAVIACYVMGLQWVIYWHQYTKVVEPIEVIHCVTKGAVFGLVLSSVACFCGYRAYGGARAVGYATRTSVVTSLLAILLTDYLLTSFLPFGFSHLKI